MDRESMTDALLRDSANWLALQVFPFISLSVMPFY
jgi:hypothetical protein